MMESVRAESRDRARSTQIGIACELRWQREKLPEVIRELVLDDQRLRNDICWSAFDC